ncbi:hypothetical protein SISSUDRAFT_1067236 [Sistotremastrum suecicum HHB10207 ss-3]|uniref:Uncharacterized protein n=1 Tax=Sistotremastrum suecicum HHB10207 ss-3 TaxID=1314776 RepID=A0A165XCD0_9AGAM|nr:hypothetical protein SISSUDRAFT_1067236 [Sistotremastrum suecicum HHB10207 ss-3]
MDILEFGNRSQLPVTRNFGKSPVVTGLWNSNPWSPLVLPLYFALDQWLPGYQNTALQFLTDEYESVYIDIMAGLQKVHDDPVYGPLLMERLEDWASDAAHETAKPPRQPISVTLSGPQAQPLPSAGSSRLPSVAPLQRRSTSPRADASSSTSSSDDNQEADGPQGDENVTSDAE